MKIYIAGKITGDPDYQQKFGAVAGILRNMGHIPLNPAILPWGMSQADYMRICFAMLDSADCAVFFRDYRGSEGAQLEYDWCVKVKKPAFLWPSRASVKVIETLLQLAEEAVAK